MPATNYRVDVADLDEVVVKLKFYWNITYVARDRLPLQQISNFEKIMFHSTLIHIFSKFLYWQHVTKHIKVYNLSKRKFNVFQNILNEILQFL